MLRRPFVLVLLGGTVLATLSGCGSSGTGSSSAPTTTWVSHAYLASSFSSDLATEATADTNYVTALNAATSGITAEEQKLTLDNNTIQKIGFGEDCDAADTSTYPSCVTSEDQTAAYARSDAASVEAQVQADFQHYASTASRYQSALGTFIDQVLGLPWPSGYDKDVVTTVSTARAFRRDVALQEAVLASTPQSSVSSINTRSLIDGGNFVAATRALTGALRNAGT